MTDPIKRCVEKYMRSLKANNAQHPNDELPVRKLAEHMWVNLGNYFGDLHANASNFICFNAVFTPRRLFNKKLMRTESVCTANC